MYGFTNLCMISLDMYRSGQCLRFTGNHFETIYEASPKESKSGIYR